MLWLNGTRKWEIQPLIWNSKIYLTLTESIVANNVIWEYHVGGCANGRYNMILARYILTTLGSNVKISERVS